MKKSFYFLIFLSNLSFSQINFEKVKPDKVLQNISGIKLIENDPDSFSICYNNAMYSQITDTKCFTTNKKTILEIGKQIEDGFKTPEEMIKFEINNYLIYIKYQKLLGSVSARFFTADQNSQMVLGQSNPLTKKQASKIFATVK